MRIRALLVLGLGGLVLGVFLLAQVLVGGACRRCLRAVRVSGACGRFVSAVLAGGSCQWCLFAGFEVRFR
jgi:hypothetical protein